VQPLGGAAEVQRLGQRDDVAKVAQFHPGAEAYRTRAAGDTWYVLIAMQYVFP
jgi:hypothetical protein